MESFTSKAKEIREYFQKKYGDVNPPATEEDILAAERQIGMTLPPILKALYRECNGFLAATGSSYLLPLLGEEDSLVRNTAFLKTQVPSSFDFSAYICFGLDGVGQYWLLRAIGQNNIEIVGYDFHWSEPTKLGSDLFSVYLACERWYEEGKRFFKKHPDL